MGNLFNFLFKSFRLFFTFSDKAYGIIPIYKDGKNYLVFLGFSKSNRWVLPKGHALIGEDKKLTALRELKEETGIKECQILDDFTFLQRYSFKLLGFLPIKKVVKFYLGSVKSKNIKLDNKEFKDYKWFSLNQAFENISFPSGKNTIKAVQKFLED